MPVLGLRILVLAVAASAETAPAHAQQPTEKDTREKIVANGLKWMASVQRLDGSFTAGIIPEEPGLYQHVMTGLAGMAFLMQGSTYAEGKYSDPIHKAVLWILKNQRDNGLYLSKSDYGQSRYMFGHGYSLMFMAIAYGDIDDPLTKRQVSQSIQRAIDFGVKAQTKHGGWGYCSAKEGGGFSETNVVVMQLQAFRAAQNAGFAVPKKSIENGMNYFNISTTSLGGVVRTVGPNGAKPTEGTERPACTAMALATAASFSRLGDENPKKWMSYMNARPGCQFDTGRGAYSDLQNFYIGQALYALGDDGYGKLFPNSNPKTRPTWSSFRSAVTAHYEQKQNPDGSIHEGYTGPVFDTSMVLMILQLDNGVLPMFHR